MIKEFCMKETKKHNDNKKVLCKINLIDLHYIREK